MEVLESQSCDLCMRESLVLCKLMPKEALGITKLVSFLNFDHLA